MPRPKRSRFGAAHGAQRYERSVVDLLNIADLALSSASSESTGIESTSIVAGMANVSNAHAERLLKVLPMLHITPVKEFLSDHSGLRVFQAREFLKSSAIPAHNHTDVSFLQCFVQLHERSSRLSSIANCFDKEAREHIVLLFLKLVAPVATICAWFTPPALTTSKLKYVLSQYISESWGTTDMKTQEGMSFSADFMADGWHLVSEVLKVCAEELLARNRSSSSGGKSDTDFFSGSVRRDDVHSEHDHIITVVLRELTAYVYHQMGCPESPRAFLTEVEQDLLAFGRKLLCAVHASGTRSVVRIEMQNTDFITIMESVRRGAPTMAEMTYCPRTMQPVTRRLRGTGRVLQTTAFYSRARRPDSTLTEAHRAKQLQVLAKGYISSKKKKTTSQATPTHSQPRWMTRPAITDKSTAEKLRAFEALEARPFRLSGLSSAEEGLETLDEHYTGDPALSDNEFVRTLDVTSAERRKDQKLDKDMELVISTFTSWRVEPHDCLGSNLTDANGDWADYHTKKRAKQLSTNISTCDDVRAYKEFWKASLLMEMRAVISDAIHAACPGLRKDPRGKDMREYFDESSPRMIRIVVRKVGHSSLLTNVKSDSTDIRLNTVIAQALAGYSVCVGFLKRRGNDSVQTPLHIVLCRSVDLRGEDVDKVGPGGRIDYISMRLCVNRRLLSYFRVGEEDVLHVLPIQSAAAILRMYKAVCSVERLPRYFQDLLYACKPPPSFLGNVDLPCFEGPAPQGVDDACWKYLKNCEKTKVQLDDRQKGAILHAVQNIGAAGKGSSSITMIQGAAGAGKTSCIRVIAGAISHHSTGGHVERDCYNHLQKDDDILRCSTSPAALRILICAPSNAAVDNIMERIDAEGLPDGKGSVITPQMVRITRIDYDREKLPHHRLNYKALPFDKHLFNKDDGDTRTSASSKARKALSEECVLVFMTLSIAGSARLQDLRSSFDVIIVDESAHALEPEILVPLVATRRRSVMNRLHVIMFGDHEQLQAMSKAEHMLRDCHVTVPSWPLFTVSLFERLHKTGRCPAIMLNRQYRMTPQIANVVLPRFYSDKITSPQNASCFYTDYNQRSSKGFGFSTMVLLNTSPSPDSREQNDGDGKYSNPFEVSVVERVLHILLKIDGMSLKDKIGIIVPYSAQVELLSGSLSSRGHICGYSVKDLGIAVSTVDSMQGRERNVIIFSATRSNPTRIVGFLSNVRRLNVAMTRARNLLIVVGDFDTICNGDIPAFDSFRSAGLDDSTDVDIVQFSNLRDVDQYANLSKICSSQTVSGDKQVDVETLASISDSPETPRNDKKLHKPSDITMVDKPDTSQFAGTQKELHGEKHMQDTVEKYNAK